jgi:hypothetical protein
LALSAYCQYCRTSAGFYRALSTAAKQRRLRVLAVLREPPGVFKPFIPALGIAQAAEIQQANFDALGIAATPTLLIVDGSGTVQNAWTGKLSGAAEQEVFHRLGISDPPPHEDVVVPDSDPTLSAGDLALLLRRSESIVLVDIRERAAFAAGHISGALNIPYDEIVPRAPHELSKSERIIVHCQSNSACEAAQRSEGTLDFCTFGRKILEEWAGFSNAVYVAADLEELRAHGVKVVGTSCEEKPAQTGQ